MYGSGAGTGMEHIKPARKIIQLERSLVLSACYAAGRGAMAVGIFVRRIGATTLPAAGTTLSVSGWCAAEFLRIRRARNGAPPPASAGGERVVEPFVGIKIIFVNKQKKRIFPAVGGRFFCIEKT